MYMQKFKDNVLLDTRILIFSLIGRTTNNNPWSATALPRPGQTGGLPHRAVDAGHGPEEAPAHHLHIVRPDERQQVLGLLVLAQLLTQTLTVHGTGQRTASGTRYRSADSRQ